MVITATSSTSLYKCNRNHKLYKCPLTTSSSRSVSISPDLRNTPGFRVFSIVSTKDLTLHRHQSDAPEHGREKYYLPKAKFIQDISLSVVQNIREPCFSITGHGNVKCNFFTKGVQSQIYYPQN